ncbi:hypothetical protein EV401DRAFT_2022471 [Pisolithus croceorrhizus]|nr:hypothetical protein EV401DRAFT_2022471 [Pisolithus croceorrhizus]
MRMCSTKRRHSRGIRSSNSMSNLSITRDQFQPLSEVPTRSNTGNCDNSSRKALARVKRFFQRSSQSHPTFTSEPSTAGGEEVPEELPRVDLTPRTGGSVDETVLVPASAAIGGNIYAEVQEYNESNPMSRIEEGEVDPAVDAEIASAEIQVFGHTYLQPFQDFNKIVTTLSNVSVSILCLYNNHIRGQVHPYVRVALGILDAASQVVPTPS